MKSFISVSQHSDFPIQNLPYGVFYTDHNPMPRVGVAIGDDVLDLSVITDAGLFKDAVIAQQKVFHHNTLNAFMELGKSIWQPTRARIMELLRDDVATLRDDSELREKAFCKQADATMLLPIKVTGYTDFYSSKQHASNVGEMFRGKDNALMPNWLHLPVAYDGRASSVVVSGTAFRRPMGQIKPGEDAPIYAASKRMDTEVELAFIVGTGSQFGEPISSDQAPEHVFGAVMLSDWSARDIQKWEYVPLGPFLGKNFCTSISPWVVTLEALEPYRTQGPVQQPEPLEYLKSSRDWNYNIELELAIKTPKMQDYQTLSTTNYKDIYWDYCQQLAHHSMGGCPMKTGDIFASGTISGDGREHSGSLLELTWSGKDPIQLDNGETRTFIEDHDTVTIRGYCDNGQARIGFGEVFAEILPAIS